MTPSLPLRPPRHWLAVALSTVLLIPPLAIAAPGAHGPNGEHLDSPSPLHAAATWPLVQAQSESFELVAELRANELAMVIDRYASNEPVLNATLEVESGALQASAVFRAEQGDYAVTDAALVQALAKPGEHGLVFTLVAGTESDLLDGTLISTVGPVATTALKNGHGHHPGSDEHDHGHDHGHELERAVGIGAAVAGLGLLGGVIWWRQCRRHANPLHKGL